MDIQVKKKNPENEKQMWGLLLFETLFVDSEKKVTIDLYLLFSSQQFFTFFSEKKSKSKTRLLLQSRHTFFCFFRDVKEGGSSTFKDIFQPFNLFLCPSLNRRKTFDQLLWKGDGWTKHTFRQSFCVSGMWKTSHNVSKNKFDSKGPVQLPQRWQEHVRKRRKYVT
jgi:hypothetical protein